MKITLKLIEPGIKALIFDCDGTLVDTMGLHWDAWHEAFARNGHSVSQAFLDRYKGLLSEMIVEQVNRQYGCDIDPVTFSREKEAIALEMLDRTIPIEPVVAIARAHRNRLPMAVASNGIRPNVLKSLEAVGILDWFDTVLSVTDPVRPKPYPDMFLEAARRMGVAPGDCQVFEDGDAGLEAACAAGMYATDVRPFLETELV